MGVPAGQIFVMAAGGHVLKPFIIVENQNECVLYAGNHIAVDVALRTGVSTWLEQQPLHLWKYAEETEGCHIAYTRYIIDEQLFPLLSLKWS